MTLFENLAIAFSLVFSFTAMRLLSGLPEAMRASRRYWVHLVYVCTALIATAIVFPSPDDAFRTGSRRITASNIRNT